MTEQSPNNPDSIGGGRLFAMQHGPFIPWTLAELIYEAYSAQYGTAQSLEKLHDRGGFSWREVEVIFSGLARRYPARLQALRQQHRIPQISPVRGAAIAQSQSNPTPNEGK